MPPGDALLGALLGSSWLGSPSSLKPDPQPAVTVLAGLPLARPEKVDRVAASLAAPRWHADSVPPATQPDSGAGSAAQPTGLGLADASALPPMSHPASNSAPGRPASAGPAADAPARTMPAPAGGPDTLPPVALASHGLDPMPAQPAAVLPVSPGRPSLPNAAYGQPSGSGQQPTASVPHKPSAVPAPGSAAPLKRSIVPPAGRPAGPATAAPPATDPGGQLNGPLIDSPLTVGPNANITRLAGHQAESTIAINPTNPSNLFSAYVNLGSNGTTMFARYSMDGGATWAPSNVSAIPPSCCDAQAAWDSFGNLFLVYLANANFNAIVVRSVDGGATLIDPRTVVVSSDQPSIAVGPSGVAGVPGSVWISTTNGSNQVVAAGAPVMGFGQVGAFNAPEVAPGPGGDFGGIGIGPAGQVMVTYQNNGSAEGPDTIKVNLDPDGLGPAPFGPVVIPTTTNVGGFALIPAQPDRSIDAEANLAWDRSGGPVNGRVYLAYTDRPSVGSADTDIYVRYSDDNGATWSDRVRVNDDAVGNGKSQFNDAIAVDQATGWVAVTWYDTRNSPASNQTAQVLGTASFDGGASFVANAQISNGTSDATVADTLGFNFGDFDTMDFYQGVFYRSWADNSNSTGDNPNGTRHAMNLYTAPVQVGSLAGPIVLSSRPSRDTFGDVSRVRFTFDREMDPATFTTAQVASFTGPGGVSIPVTGVTPVDGTDNKQFDVTFAGQHPLGNYTMVIGPDIEDTGGNPMDQNLNGIPGEPGLPPAGDQYAAPFTIQGPKIIASTPADNQLAPVGSLRVTFNEPMDPSTFTPAKIPGFNGPNGFINVQAVTPVAGSNNTQFDITFPPQVTTGHYLMLIGPDIRDLAGHQMDQNGNFIEGEIPGDLYAAPFGIQGPRVTAAAPTTPATPFALRVTFSEPIEASTFTADKIDSFTGPNGAIGVAGVVPVAGSNFTQLDVIFAPQTTAGLYTLVLGPDIQDVFGNLMDQNGNLIPGEIPGDEYAAQFIVTGPKVTASTPAGNSFAPAGQVRVTFSAPMDPSTFTRDQVVSFTGPQGTIPVTSVTAVPLTNNTQFDITFDAQEAPGDYAMVIGPHIRDIYGNEMDQNQNGITGEIPGDQYTARFTLFSTTVGPDGFGYTGTVSPFENLDLEGRPGTFTIIQYADDEADPVDLGTNTFNFYGRTYTGNNQLFVSSNGLITFGSGNTEYINTNLTNDPTQSAIAPLWTDWIKLSGTPMVLGRFEDPDNDGVPDRLVIQWNRVQYFGGSQPITFQAILSLNTGDAASPFGFNYVDLGDLDARNIPRTVGIKDTGTQGANRLLVTFNASSPFLQTGNAMLFSVAPTNLQVTDATPSGASLRWGWASSGEQGFQVERSTDGTSFTPIGTTGPGEMTFTDPAVSTGGTYAYRVRAVTAVGLSPASNVDSVRIGPVTIDHSGGFADHGDLTTNGNATFVAGVARVTTDAFNQAGSIFTRSRVDVTRFTAAFTFRFTPGSDPSGNGITFTIQGNGPTALGPLGGGLGYGPDQPDPNHVNKGIRNSVAVKFDLNNNAGEGDSSTGIFTDGRSPTVREPGLDDRFPDMSVDLTGTGVYLHDPDLFEADLAYDGTTLQVTIRDTGTGASASQSYAVDIPGLVGSNVAYVGFTGGTGAIHTAFQDVPTWTFAAGGASGVAAVGAHSARPGPLEAPGSSAPRVPVALPPLAPGAFGRAIAGVDSSSNADPALAEAAGGPSAPKNPDVLIGEVAALPDSAGLQKTWRRPRNHEGRAESSQAAFPEVLDELFATQDFAESA